MGAIDKNQSREILLSIYFAISEKCILKADILSNANEGGGGGGGGGKLDANKGPHHTQLKKKNIHININNLSLQFLMKKPI